jgi:large subunit ribosomal protein L5
VTQERQDQQAQEGAEEKAAPQPGRTRRGSARQAAAPAEGGRRRARPAAATPAPAQAPALPRLLTLYRDEVLPALRKELAYKNIMQVPRLQKVVINVGLGEALTNQRALEAATNDITQITGQKPVTTKARRSVANFKVREGQAIGVMVTLRGARMYYFLDKLFSAALPTTRDFRGISRTAFDGRGNYSLGLRDQIIFPEIDYNQIDKLRGLQVNIITTAHTDPEALRLLDLLGAPFVRQAEGIGAVA